MNGKTHAYLDLAALPAVGKALLDGRPAFVFRGDGSRILWANAAGATFFGETSMGTLLDRQLSALNPLTRQLARLARLLPTEPPRVEILRFGFGVRLATLPAACRRLNLADGTTAVLALAAVSPPAESVVARAERLADTIGARDCLAAVLARDGRVLGASGGFADLAAASDEIDTLIEAATAERIVKRLILVDGRERPAGVARVEAGEGPVYLLIVGPEEAARLPAAAAPERNAEPSPVPAALPEPAAAPRIAPVPFGVSAGEAPAPAAARNAVRFLWQTDADQRFTFVSPELGETIGTANVGLLGRTWREVAEALALDPEARVGEALAGHGAWGGITVAWPVHGAAERLGVTLSANPILARGNRFAGFRGLGSIDLADRRPGAPLPEAPPVANVAPPPVLREEEVDNAARRTIEEGRPVVPAPEPPKRASAEIVALPAAPKPLSPSNVVRLPGPATPRALPPERLSGTEQDAFRRIAEALGVGMPAERREQPADKPAAPAESPRAEPPAAEAKPLPPAPAPATEADLRLLDKLPLGIVVFRDRKTLFANRRLLDLLGYETLADFVAAGGADAIFPGGSPDWSKADPTGLVLARRSDHETISVEARLHAATWSGATALMLSLLPRAEPARVSDEELAAELALAADRVDELEAILDTATDGVVVVDGRGRIGNFNRSAEALFGIAAKDVLGRPFTDLLAEESRKAALDYLDGLAENGVASVLNDGREVIGKVPQGGLIPLFMTMGRLGAAGEKFCAVLRDITHWKNVEEELIAARRAAEAANAQKSDFLAKISHEIRTPLNAIIGFSEVMMEERFGPIGNERYRNYLRDIHVSGAHLMSLINDLLDLSKIEAGKLDLHFESVAVNAVIQECVALMQPQANRARIIIRTSLSAGVPNIVADARSLRQILLNLLSNAIKFTKAGGQVIVASALEENGEVTLRIRDTGIGMSEKDIETAMKPFRQIATARARSEGTGLGLPLTKALVEANRATFTLDSVPDQGTLVRITFPMTRVLAG